MPPCGITVHTAARGLPAGRARALRLPAFAVANLSRHGAWLYHGLRFRQEKTKARPLRPHRRGSALPHQTMLIHFDLHHPFITGKYKNMAATWR